MLRKSLLVLGASCVVLMTAGCLGYGERHYYPPPPPPEAMEQPDAGQQTYNVAPRPNPHKDAAIESTAHGQPTKSAEGESPATHAKAAEAAGSNESKKVEKTADAHKPLTPAEIRAAVPVQRVSNPKQTLSSAKIKSLWGDVLGQVHSVDVSDGTVKAVDADVGKGIVRIDAGHLKYVKSRNVLVTTMSKPDVAKLPRVDTP
jgi:cytoskeletal protein RodZ